MPPDNWCGNSRTRCSGEAIRTRASISRARSRASRRERFWCRATDLRDLASHGVQGIQRGHRLLENHRNLAAPDPGGFPGRWGPGRSGRRACPHPSTNSGWRRVTTPCPGGDFTRRMIEWAVTLLPQPLSPDDAQGGIAVQVQGHAVDRPHRCPFQQEVDGPDHRFSRIRRFASLACALADPVGLWMRHRSERRGVGSFGCGNFKPAGGRQSRTPVHAEHGAGPFTIGACPTSAATGWFFGIELFRAVEHRSLALRPRTDPDRGDVARPRHNSGASDPRENARDLYRIVDMHQST